MTSEGGEAPPPPSGAKKIDAFHAHLDVCVRCARNPFDLCSEGDRLIRAAVEEDEKEP